MFEIQPNSAALFYRKIREVIAYHLEQESHGIFDGVVKLDESYFDGVRKGKRSWHYGKGCGIGYILKRSGKVYTKVVVTKSEMLIPLITRKIAPDSIV